MMRNFNEQNPILMGSLGGIFKGVNMERSGTGKRRVPPVGKLKNFLGSQAW